MTLARTAEVRSYAMLSSLDFAVWLDHLQKDTSGSPTGVEGGRLPEENRAAAAITWAQEAQILNLALSRGCL